MQKTDLTDEHDLNDIHAKVGDPERGILKIDLILA